ncbi:hypothetical protein DDW05_00805 [Candidatus Nanobsidianus stetteri]|uniref:Uncharacterized protein n=1 Tax=Nanobsidianus stetteri TaxID=1294122 RepID=A0A2T9WUM7_NANST|nr:hypothetical protein DDW05_00805 [Candidatus Nanobsidianus stetteri]
MVDTSSYQKQSKTSEELVTKKLNKAIAAYTSYLFTKSNVLERVSEKEIRALRPLERIIKKLDEFGECKSFLTKDPETLQKCIDEYEFKDGLLRGISAYHIWERTPEQIEEFTKGLEALSRGGKRAIKDLYQRFQQYKITSVPQEDLDPRLFAIIPEISAIESLILRYLENPRDYRERVSKYLGKKPLEARIEKGKEVESYDELRRAIKGYALYLSYKEFALKVVSEHIPEALPSLVKLIENLEEWRKYRIFSYIDKKYLKEYADKYYVMAHILSIIPEWWLSKWEHTPEEIKRFTEGLEFLARKGKEIANGLYKLYKEAYRLALEDISKGKQTIYPYELENVRSIAAGRIRYLLEKYFRNPEEYEDQLMKYAGLKPLD